MKKVIVGKSKGLADAEQCDIHVVVGSENCNKCKKEISREEFDDGMGECLVCFPKF